MATERKITLKGKQELEEELDILKTVKRAEIAEQIKIARSFGDLSENAEYTEARNEQSRIEGRILELENILRTAVVVNEIDLKSIGVGTKVRLLDVEMNEEEEYRILGFVDVEQGIISSESPVGKALLGHVVGDVVEVQVPMGTIQYKVLEITKAEH